MAPVSLSNFPSAWVRSSSVSLPHCSLTLPRSCCHLPATMSRFIRDSPFCLTIRCARRSASPKARGASRTPHRLADGSPIHRAQFQPVELSHREAISLDPDGRRRRRASRQSMSYAMDFPSVARAAGRAAGDVAQTLPFPGASKFPEATGFEAEEGGKNNGPHRHRLAGASPGRRAADLALQQRLGLLPERRLGSGASDRADPCAHRTTLGSDSQSPTRRNVMRQTNIMVTGFAIAALVAAGGGPVYAQSSTTQKVEQKAEDAKDKVKSTGEEAKDKTKSMAQDAKQGMSDSWITSKTKIALFSDDRVKGRQVHVETKGGTVMLRGKVDDAEAKTAAGEIAKGIDGVKSVKNELQVVAPSNRKAVDADDKQITKSIEDRFKQDPQLKNAKIDAKVNAGVVTLTGEVKSIGTSARASEVARSVAGVRSVKNDLTYASSSSLMPSQARN